MSNMFYQYRKNIFLSILLLPVCFKVYADGEQMNLAWELEGLNNPESVIYDPRLNQLYVSNINGAPDARDGNGYLSIVSMDGRIVNEKWMINLNAPKGLAIYDRSLYVADIDELVEIDIDRGRILNRYKVDDAKFLNDVTATTNGDIYVSDMVLNRIHVLSGGEFTIWLETEALESPNGLLARGDHIILGSWGVMTDGFATDVPGHLKRISIADKTITSIGDGSPVGNLDGVESDADGDFYVTDWMNGKLFHIGHNGEVTTLLEFEQGSADHEFVLKKNMMFIPLMKQNKLLAYKVHHE